MTTKKSDSDFYDFEKALLVTAAIGVGLTLFGGTIERHLQQWARRTDQPLPSEDWARKRGP